MQMEVFNNTAVRTHTKTITAPTPRPVAAEAVVEKVVPAAQRLDEVVGLHLPAN